MLTGALSDRDILAGQEPSSRVLPAWWAILQLTFSVIELGFLLADYQLIDAAAGTYFSIPPLYFVIAQLT